MFKNNFIVKSTVLAFLLCHGSSIYAGQKGDIEGVYTPSSGWVESQELYPGESIGEQIGKFKIVLKRQGWNLLSAKDQDRIRKKLIIKGVLHGLADNSGTEPFMSHQLTSNDRDGAAFTEGDSFFITEVTPCSATGIVLSGIETLNFTYGTGLYQSLQAGSSLILHSTLDSCTGQIDFEVIKGQGGLCFGTESCD